MLSLSRFKQVAAIFGDATFQASRRWFLEQANAYGLTQTWSYLFTAVPAGTPAYLGGGLPHLSSRTRLTL
jgi:hypothetical protein